MTYLLVYQRSTGSIRHQSSFHDKQAEEVQSARLAYERQFGFDPDVEVVTLVASDFETLLATHGRYFRTLHELGESLASEVA